MSDKSNLADPIRRAAFWGSFPLVAPQGLWIRRTAPRFADAEGPREGIVGDGPRVRILGLGDSIIAGVGIPSLDQALPGQFAGALAERRNCRVHWFAIGKTGACSADIRRELLPMLPAESLDIVFVSVGINDVTGLVRTGPFSRNLAGLIDDIRRHSPDALIVMLGLPPLWGFPLLPQPLRAVLGMRAGTFDRVMRSVVERRGDCLYVPTSFDPSPEKFGEDGYHPSAESCREWGTDLAEIVSEQMP